MAIRTYNIHSTIANVVASDAKSLATLATACNALAKAVVAFAGVKAGEKDKRNTFASIASVARVSYDDALAIVASSIAIRASIRTMRVEVVRRIKSDTCHIVHDAINDADTIKTLDKVVQALVTIAKHESYINRDYKSPEVAVAEVAVAEVAAN